MSEDWMECTHGHGDGRMCRSCFESKVNAKAARLKMAEQNAADRAKAAEAGAETTAEAESENSRNTESATPPRLKRAKRRKHEDATYFRRFAERKRDAEIAVELGVSQATVYAARQRWPDRDRIKPIRKRKGCRVAS